MVGYWFPVGTFNYVVYNKYNDTYMFVSNNNHISIPQLRTVLFVILNRYLIRTFIDYFLLKQTLVNSVTDSLSSI